MNQSAKRQKHSYWVKHTWSIRNPVITLWPTQRPTWTGVQQLQLSCKDAPTATGSGGLAVVSQEAVQ